MGSLCYRRHRFLPEVIQHAIWLYLRFTLSYRDVEELLAERGLEISYETVRRWVLKFGPAIRDGCASVALGRAITGIWMRWWCASAASECICGVPSTTGEVLDMLVQRRRDSRSAG
jgi:putative transposase